MGIGTFVQMIGQGVAGRAKQQSYNAQAAQAELQGRTQAIQYKTQAANILRNLNETIATITARAGASGGVGGSAGALLRNVSGQGGAEYATSIDNATLALAGAQTQAAIYRYSGKVAKINSQIQMVSTGIQGIERAVSLGTGGSGGTTGTAGTTGTTGGSEPSFWQQNKKYLFV
jgi:hypothetical protein